MIFLDLRRHFSAHTFAFIAFSYHFLSRRATFRLMPRIGKNGSPSTQQLKAGKTPALTASDLCALRDFVNKRLTEPSSLQDNNPLPLSVLIEQNPDVYRNAVDLLSAGNSVQAVAHATSIPLQTIRAVAHVIPDYRLIVRETTARNLSQSSLRMSEVLLERADKMPIDRIPFALAVTVEKSELLGGAATSRIEHKKVITRGELQAMFEALPRAKVLRPALEDDHSEDQFQGNPPD
jgi:hypothetical protein